MLEIWSYIAQDNPTAADKLIQTLASKFPLLGSMPELGRKRDDLAVRLRSLPVTNYVIFYRMELEGHGVEIVRVLHGSRDLPPLFL